MEEHALKVRAVVAGIDVVPCVVRIPHEHVGSRAIRSFVAAQQPRLVLSGHIHESPRISGAWRDQVGRTPVVNPGQFGSPKLAGVWFDPRRPGEALRHTVLAES